MRRINCSAGVALAAVSALAGCSPKGPDTPPQPPPPRVSPNAPGAPALSAITAVCPTLPADLKVVKIQVSDVSPKGIGHTTALFAANADGTASSDKKLKDIPEVLFKTPNPTRLDFDAAEFLAKPGDVILVEVELTDAAASFAPGPAAVTAGDDAGAAMLCLKDKDRPVNPKPGDKIVRFYVQDVASQTPLYGKFNLFVLLKDGPYVTPVILDPKIHN